MVHMFQIVFRVSSTGEVLKMSVVRGMRGVGEVCEMYMRLARGSVGMRGFCLGQDLEGWVSCESGFFM